MSIHSIIIGGGDKRWYDKVVNRAEFTISALVEDFSPSLDIVLETKYDGGRSGSIVVEHASQQNRDIFAATLFYSTREWESLVQAFPLCVSQLASALFTLCEKRKHAKLNSIFLNEGINLVEVIERVGSEESDGLTDIYVYISTELSEKCFFKLVDEFDQHLVSECVGEVSGNSVSMTGDDSCIDLVGKNAEVLVASAKRFLTAKGISEYRISEG